MTELDLSKHGILIKDSISSIANLEGVKAVKIETSPRWWPFMPFLPYRITIEQE